MAEQTEQLSYEQARQRLVEQVPDGYELISIRVDREVAAG